MTDHDLTPLSPMLRALVDAERGNVVADPSRAASVLAATEGVIALSLAAGVGTAAAAAAASAGTSAGVKATAAAAKGAVTISIGKVVGIAVVAFAVGTGVGASVDRATAPRTAELPAPPVATVAIAPPPTVPRVEEPSAVAPSATVTASAAPAVLVSAPAPAAAASTTSRGRGDLAQEQAIIDAARAGLASGRNEDVLVAAERHAQSFPRGQFSEERDAMRILALARLGRSTDAKKHAEQFRAAYPKSALLPKVEAAVQ